jgi:hypothetical protein
LGALFILSAGSSGFKNISGTGKAEDYLKQLAGGRSLDEGTTPFVNKTMASQTQQRSKQNKHL